VLDNCEHLLEPLAGLAETVLRECHDVHVLATSREVLSVPGEHVVGLRSLRVPHPSDTPDQITASDAVELFLERARAARAGFSVDATNAEAVAEVCRRLDGIPLAIELAAARAGAMSPAEIASHLDERFRLLRGGRRTALERHQTLRATVDWSYSLLDEAERTVFDRLGVFAGPFHVLDARSVVSGEDIDEWDVIDALASLVSKSMLIADEENDGVTHYQMLETIRAYARERLDDSGESDAWRRRLAQRYAQFSSDARDALYGRDELQWRRRLRAELDNVRAAAFWSLDSTEPGDRGFALAIVANLAVEVTLDRAADFGAWAERALPFVDEATPAQRPAAIAAAAFNAYHRGEIDTARVLALEALADGVPVDCPAPAMPFVARSVIDMSSGRNAEAVAALDDALATSQAIAEHPYSRANLLAVRSFMRLLAGDVEGARLDGEESLTLSRRLENPSQTVIALTALGNAVVDQDPLRAREAFEESLALVRQGASDVNLSLALVQLARLRMRDGDTAGAFEAVRIAVIHHHRHGDRPGLVGTLLIEADMLMAVQSYRPAVVLIGAAISGVLSPLAAGMSVALSQLEVPLARAREALGDADCDAALAEGTALSYEALVAYALDAIDALVTDVEVSGG
jgi:predicted ATPase